MPSRIEGDGDDKESSYLRSQIEGGGIDDETLSAVGGLTPVAGVTTRMNESSCAAGLNVAAVGMKHHEQAAGLSKGQVEGGGGDEE